MVESKTSIPHFYLTSEVAMDAALEFREALLIALGDDAKIGINDLVVKASALALAKFPEVNASFAGDRIEYHDGVHVGIAVAVPHGLVVPVLRNADQMPLRDLAREVKELIERTRTNRLAPADWEGATFTVSNLGMFDVDEFAAIITPPQSAVLAVASIRRVPIANEDRVVIAQRMKLTLSADHRVYYGATAAEFLREVKRLLENPLILLL
jgi:pyruvate dehydrogenase E2 component (dihydrolipoamide acetyltransferase)